MHVLFGLCVCVCVCVCVCACIAVCVFACGGQCFDCVHQHLTCGDPWATTILASWLSWILCDKSPAAQ